MKGKIITGIGLAVVICFMIIGTFCLVRWAYQNSHSSEIAETVPMFIDTTEIE